MDSSKPGRSVVCMRKAASTISFEWLSRSLQTYDFLLRREDTKNAKNDSSLVKSTRSKLPIMDYRAI